MIEGPIVGAESMEVPSWESPARTKKWHRIAEDADAEDADANLGGYGRSQLISGVRWSLYAVGLWLSMSVSYQNHK